MQNLLLQNAVTAVLSQVSMALQAVAWLSLLFFFSCMYQNFVSYLMVDYYSSYLCCAHYLVANLITIVIIVVIRQVT